MDYDLIIVGGGPAGLSAAINAKYFKLKALVLESAEAGGDLINSYPWKIVDNYLGFYNQTGAEVARAYVKHVRDEGVPIQEGEAVTAIKREDDCLKVVTEKAEYTAKTALIAIGLGVPRKLGVEGENLKGVIYALPDPKKFKDKRVLVVGGGDTAVERAAALGNAGADATIIHRKDAFRASEENQSELSKSGAKIVFNTEVKELRGRRRLKEAVLVDNKSGEESILEVDYTLLSLGRQAHTKFLERIGVEVDDRGRVVVDGEQRTSIPGVFAAGDVTGKWVRIPQAVGEGGYAAIAAFKYLHHPYWE